MTSGNCCPVISKCRLNSENHFFCVIHITGSKTAERCAVAENKMFKYTTVVSYMVKRPTTICITAGVPSPVKPLDMITQPHHDMGISEMAEWNPLNSYATRKIRVICLIREKKKHR